eukprot:TRINITY_DN1582_c0_g1_i8.p1 TRINITY_DN1582_c0_g1~~TRINITY_DN1582_c0_g1_i8.p1  ORF type:complete len:463 (-),score=127.17 TRINITY_DN1582_c0_g1_i8:63-1451(-)
MLHNAQQFLGGPDSSFFFFQAEDGIRDFCLSRGLGDVYKRQGYSKDNQILYVTLISDEGKYEDISDESREYNIQFSLSVQFVETEKGEADALYSDLPYANDTDPELDEEIQWISIINSFILVALLVGFVSIIIIRIVKNDINKALDTEAGDRDEEVQWKLIRTEVFQIPSQRNLLCALTGSGMQLTSLVFILVVIGCLGVYYGADGSVKAAAWLLYSLTAIIAGYVSGRLYKYLNGPHWALNIITTAVIFPIPLFIIWFILNNLAWAYGSSAAIPFGTIVIILLMWAVVTFPLTILGGITGRMKAKDSVLDDKFSKLMKPIPVLLWYRKAPISFLIAGIIPFSAVYLQLNYIFQSIWGHRLYHLYGILLLAFVLLIIVTACVNISLIYFQLNSQDYRWWWRSFINGGAPGLFLAIYSGYYYFNNSHMQGFLQTLFFFGYSGLLSIAVYLSLGAVSFLSLIHI